MHRSGTSLITRLVNLLGLAVCRDDDLLVGREVNPRGHWESKSMVEFNDRLLGELGAAWFCPPLLGADDVAPLLDRNETGARAALRDAHPERPFVWKDPRTSVLLPFWSAVLGERAAYVHIVRHPLEVGESLARRNGFTPRLSLALWERYTRQAMLGAAGRPMMLCTYDAVLADPVAWCDRLVAFLGEQGSSVRTFDKAAVGAFATSGLRHSHESWSSLRRGPLISEQQVDLAHAANTFVADASYVPPALPPETPDTEAIFGKLRDAAKQTGGPLRLASLPTDLATATPGASSEQTLPPVSLIVSQAGTSSEASILALGATLPPGSEILAVGAGVAGAIGGLARQELLLREVPCDGTPSEARALALGVQAANGSIVLLSSGQISRCDPWYPRFSKVLARRDVGGVAPVVRFNSCPDLLHAGRAFTDQDLDSSFVVARGDARLMPAPLLPDVLCAFERELLAAAGGVDMEFSSAGAAVAELSLRLWRMGFRCCVVPQISVWKESVDVDRVNDVDGLHDRLRIAALHFGRSRLERFTERASRHPSYDAAAERLAATDLELRRATIEAVCAFPIDRYFDDFPLRLKALRSALRGAERRTRAGVRWLRFVSR